MDAQLILTLILKDEAKQYELSQDKADEIFTLFNQSVIILKRRGTIFRVKGVNLWLQDKN